MMLGRPLITTKGTLVGQIVEEEKIGFIASYGSIKELSQMLDHLRNNQKEREEIGRRARRLYEMRYSSRSQCRKFLEFYREICPTLFAEHIKETIDGC
jgi:glycosyltransferase involved in cell wall biosynthesis